MEGFKYIFGLILFIFIAPWITFQALTVLGLAVVYTWKVWLSLVWLQYLLIEMANLGSVGW